MGTEYTVGQRLGDYEVLGVLGAGGMGRVYKVRNVISDRVEAMKIVLPNLANQKELADRFLREIKVLGALDHPNIAALRTALTIDNELIMIMEYVEGVTLASRLQQAPLPIAEAVNYADQVLSALSYAHKLNVIHRDIKPSNMMLTPQGVVKLLDFGLARPGEQPAGMTVTNTTLGSVSYMPPEQVKGETVDARSDLYSLGVSLYEMVVGKLPFQGESGYSLMTAHVQEAPKAPITVRPDIPKTLNDIILIAMSKEPVRRFQSADAFRNALKNVPVSQADSPMASDSTTTAKAAAAAATASAPVPQKSSAPQTVQSVTEPVPAVVSATSAPSPTGGGRGVDRGIYMALGGLLVVGALFAAGFYLPRRIKTHANPTASTPTAPVTVPVATEPISTPALPATTSSEPPTAAPTADPVAATPSASATPMPVEPQGKNPDAPLEKVPAQTMAKQPAKVTAEPTRTAVPASATRAIPLPPATAQEPASGGMPMQQSAPPQASANAAEIEQTQHETDQLTSRAMAVSQSLDGIRRGQAAQGLGLRGDIAASEQRMKADLNAAQSALDKQDATGAKKYLGYAEAEAEKLEKFLGR